MYAVAAAHATRPAKIKGTQHLDIYDVRIIQYRSAMLKLSDTVRLLGVLERNLEKKQETGKTIIPLINYVLSLCEGPVFNVHPILRKRFTLLSECKLSKQNEINMPPSTSNVEYDVDFAPLVIDLLRLRESIYNSNLQWKLMGCLKSISENALNIYEKKLRNVSTERASKRIADFPGKVIPMNYEAIDDILRPFEMELCLDWAVLINDQEQDTSFNSLKKLQSQILTRFLSNINEKVLPTIRNYFNQLQKACNSRSSAVTNLKELPHWEFSVHRMYSYIYRVLCVLDIIISMTRQLWLPNKDNFYSLRSQLSSLNVYTYRCVLDKIDLICREPKSQITSPIIAVLDSCSNPNLNITVAPNTISEIFTNSICKVTPILRDTLQSVTSWLEAWKYVDNNFNSHEKLQNLNEKQLFNMLQERLVTDKAKQTEIQQKNRLTPDRIPSTTGGLTRTGSTIRRGNSRRLSPSASPAVSSNPASPIKAPPLISSQNSPVDKTNSKGSNISSPQLPRSSNVDIRVSSPTSHSGSPQVSRRGSISDSRLAGSVLAKNTNDQKNAPRSPLTSRLTNGRPRSSSLQSDHNEATKTNHKAALPSRSNSLQTHATVNQKKIQDNFTRLTRSRSINGLSSISGGPNGRKSQQSAKKTRTQSLIGNPPTSGREVFKNTSETSPLSELEELSIDSANDAEKKKHDTEQNDNVPSIEGSSSVKKQTQQQQDTGELRNSVQLQGQQQDNQSQETEYENWKSLDHKTSDGEKNVSSIMEPGQEQLNREGSGEEVQSTDSQQDQSKRSSLHENEHMSIQNTDNLHSIQKKVRFTGVGPMTEDELARPTKRGWYRKPAVLHYPPPPPQYLGQKFRLRQEGIAFRTSLREEKNKESTENRNSMSTAFDEIAPPPQRESVSHRFASKLREKLK